MLTGKIPSTNIAYPQIIQMRTCLLHQPICNRQVSTNTTIIVSFHFIVMCVGGVT